MSFKFNTVPRIKFGLGSLVDCQNEISVLLGNRILLVTDEGLTSLGLYEPLLTMKNVEKVIVFDKVEADPSLLTVFKAIQCARENSITGIIGFGGGSPMDVAKLTALICGSGENLDKAWGVGNAVGPRYPLCLIPTTSGTGSEVTPISIITIQGDEKRGVVSPILLPDLAVLDPKLTICLPAAITAATGIDAMVHAVEAFSSINVNNNVLSKTMAKESLALLCKSIRIAVEDGKNLPARSDMLLGSMMAGMAFANSPVAAVHALAYPLGGTFHIPHGLSNALVLPEVLKFNAQNNKAAQAYANLANIVNPKIDRMVPAHSKAIMFVQYFKDLSRELGLPSRLRDLKIPKSSLKKLAHDAIQQERLLVNNPCPITKADVLKIYQSVW